MLGADTAALRRLRHRGDVDCVVVHGSRDKDSGRTQVDDAVVPVFAEDGYGLESVLSALARSGRTPSDFDAIYTRDEHAVVLAATLGRLGDIATIAPGAALRFRDKSLQKERVRQAGLPTADTYVLDDLTDLDPASVAHLLPAVLKPIAGISTKETALVTNVAGLTAAVEMVRQRGGLPRTFLLESVVTGPEWFCNGLVVGGEVRFMALGRYAHPCLSVLSAGLPAHSYQFSREYAADAYELAAPTVRDALAALGLRDGAFHMELFHQPEHQRFVFSECAARRGGGLAQERIADQFGVDLAGAAVDIALGVPPDLSDVQARYPVVGSTFLPIKGGYLVSCPDARDLAKQPHVRYARIERPLGVQLRDATTAVADKLGQVMVSGADEVTVLRRLADITAWFHDRIVTLPDDGDDRERWEHTRAAGFTLESGLIPALG
ncbi:MAG TPA: hypothetical protein VGN37_17770 [Actinocatenispora sp.]